MNLIREAQQIDIALLPSAAKLCGSFSLQVGKFSLLRVQS